MDNVQKNRAFSGIGKALLVVAIIGSINWGLVGFFNWNLVDAIFGGGSAEETSTLSRVVYAIVGLAGLFGLFMLPRMHATVPPMARPA